MVRPRLPRWLGGKAICIMGGCLIVLSRLSLPVAVPSAEGQGFAGTGQLAGEPNAFDERNPKLITGGPGTIFRLWQRAADERAGGGSAVLARAEENGWRTVQDVRSSEAGVNIDDPDLAVGSPEDVLALVYRLRRHSPRTKQIRLARSDDNGKTWAQMPSPVDQSGKAFEPRVAWGQSRTLVVVWADEKRGSRLFDVYARRSLDGGATWEPPQRLSEFPEQLTNDYHARPKLLGDGQNRFWVVWTGLRGGRSSLYLSRSTNGGHTWTPPLSLSDGSRSVYAHSLHRAGERLLLVWQDVRTGLDRIYAVSSVDGGVSWSSSTRVDHIPAESTAVASQPAAVISANGDVLIVWQDSRNGRDDIYLAHSADGGRTWDAEDVRLDQDEAGLSVSRFPRIARDESGRAAVAWEDDRAGHPGIFLRTRSAGSANWAPEMRVTAVDQKKAAHHPWLLWSRDGTLYVTWEVWDHSLGSSRITKQIDGRPLRPVSPEAK